MTRIATLAQQQLTQAQITQTQQRLQDLQTQLSSGQKAQRYSGIASDSDRLINLESMLTRTDQYTKSNDVINLRLQTMETSVSSTFDIASKLKTLLTSATSGSNASDLSLNQTAQNMLEEVERQLNVKIGDRYLFAGTATDTKPVDINDPSFTTPPGSYPSTADTSYYQGDSTKLANRVADNYDLTWGATADESGFEQLIRALHLTATATTSPTTDTTRLNDALNVVNQAIQNIPIIRSRIGASQSELDTVKSSHEDMSLYVQQNVSDIKSVDVTMATTELSSNQLLLEASYMTVSRLSQLSLANFMH